MKGLHFVEQFLNIRYHREGDFFDVFVRNSPDSPCNFQVSHDFLQKMLAVREEELKPIFFGGRDDKEPQCPILKHGTRRDEDGSSWCHWAVVRVEDAEKVVGEPFSQEAEDFEEILTGWGRFSHGVGRAFASDPIGIRYGKKLLIKWYGGLDI